MSVNWSGAENWSILICLAAAYFLIERLLYSRYVEKYKIDSSAMCRVMQAMIVEGFSDTKRKPIR